MTARCPTCNGNVLYLNGERQCLQCSRDPEGQPPAICHECMCIGGCYGHAWWNRREPDYCEACAVVVDTTRTVSVV